MSKKKIILVLSLLGVFLGLMSFYPAPPSPPPPNQSDYEQNPPIPIAYWVKKLPQQLPDGSNMRIKIKYQELEPMPAVLTVFVGNGNNTINFYDDGTHADSVAGDSIYTAYIHEDITTFQNTISSRIATINSQPILLGFTGHIGSQLTGNISFNMNAFNSHTDVSISPLLLSGYYCSTNLVKQKSLFITDLSVVEDQVRTFNAVDLTGSYLGIWNFGTMMKNIANNAGGGPHAKDLIKSWLLYYLKDTTINGDIVHPRPHIVQLLIGPWLRRAGITATINDANWVSFWNTVSEDTLLKYAPFKLTAIVNRIDLRGNVAYNSIVNNAGETRFIFSLIDPNVGDYFFNGGLTTGEPPFQNNNANESLDLYDWKGMNIIFEYGNTQKNLCDIISFANQWYALSNYTLGSTEYLTALEAITRTVLNAGAAGAAKVNGSALNRIRTNERVFDNATTDPDTWRTSDWEFRQFQLGNDGLFRQVPLTNTPVNVANGIDLGDACTIGYTPTTAANSDDMLNLINWVFSSPANITRVYNGTHNIPPFYPYNGTIRPLLAGVARVDAEYLHFWDLYWYDDEDAPNYLPHAPSIIGSPYYEQVRTQLSLNTCQGCHNGETQTMFTHVAAIGYKDSAKYWVNPPNYKRDSIDKRFSYPCYGSDYPYPVPAKLDSIVRISAFLTGRNYRYKGSHASSYFDDSTSTAEDATDNTMNGLFYVNAADNGANPIGVKMKFGYNDLQRREQDLCKLINSSCTLNTINVLQLVSHIPFPIGSH